MADAADYEAIRALIHEYCYLLDAGDFVGVALLCDEADFGASNRTERRHGRREIRAMYDDVILYDGRPCTLHQITNTTIHFDDAPRAGSAESPTAAQLPVSATARSYFMVQQSLVEFPLQTILAGEYRDRFTLAHSEWRFAERVVHPDRIGDLSRHMARGARDAHR